MKILRSMLFVPGNNERRVDKALALNADAVILDPRDLRCRRIRGLAGPQPPQTQTDAEAGDAATHHEDMAIRLRMRERLVKGRWLAIKRMNGCRERSSHLFVTRLSASW